MEVEAASVGVKTQVPRPRPFVTSEGVAPGPRCGHTLTSVPDLNRLVLFGEWDGFICLRDARRGRSCGGGARTA
jgi:hypothetical protein